MGSAIIQIGTMVLLEANKGANNSQFPFLAAVILVAIVVIVTIGDARAGRNKDEQEEENVGNNEEKNEDKNKDN